MKRSLVLGGTGLVGKVLCKVLDERGESFVAPSRLDLDLLCQEKVQKFFLELSPERVYFLAARTGGIMSEHESPAEFIRDNLVIQTNVIHAAHVARVPRLLFVSSASIYSDACPQPVREEYVEQYPLPSQHQFYAVAKLAGMKMVEAYCKQYGHKWIVAVPTNLYGPGDSTNEKNANVVAGMMARMHRAKEAKSKTVTVRGTGKVTRDFLHVSDFAEACVVLMEKYFDRDPINVGSGAEVSIQELAETLKSVVRFEGELVNDLSCPDGQPRRVLDAAKILALGWKPRIPLRRGLELTYDDLIKR